jgi:L,D-transpeptidase ErfK/SrfK
MSYLVNMPCAPWSVRVACAALGSALLTGCSLFGAAFSSHQKAVTVAPPAVVAPTLAVPVPTFKFEIDPDHDGVVGVVQMVTTSKEDTLSDIARRFDVGYEEIVRANPGVDPWLPGADRQIVVPTQFVLPDAPREGVVINIAAMRLYYFPPRKPGERQVFYTHPIGIGKVGWATPEGTTKIVRRQTDPIWRPPVSVIKEHRENGDDLAAVVGPGPDNPLGRHAFYLAWPGYLIHGTNKPYGVGLRSSHGCIRLYPEDIAFLYERIPIGTHVHVVNQPFVFGWHQDKLYMQAYGSLEDDQRDWKKAQQRLLSKSLGPAVQNELTRRKDEVQWDLILDLAHTPRGLAVVVDGAGGSLEQVLANAQRVQNRVPDGATWDGKTDLPLDEKTYQEMLSERDPSQPASANPQKSGT